MFQEEEGLRFPPLVTKPFIPKQPPQPYHPRRGGSRPLPPARRCCPRNAFVRGSPPRTPAAGVSQRFYVFILDGGAPRPPLLPPPAALLLIHFHRRSPSGWGGGISSLLWLGVKR